MTLCSCGWLEASAANPENSSRRSLLMRAEIESVSIVSLIFLPPTPQDFSPGQTDANSISRLLRWVCRALLLLHYVLLRGFLQQGGTVDLAQGSDVCVPPFPQSLPSPSI